MKYSIKLLDKIILILSSIILLFAAGMLIFTVFYRYIVIDFLGVYLENYSFAITLYDFFISNFDTLSATTDEIPGYFLVWISFLGAYLAERENIHIKFEMLVENLPNEFRVFFQTIPNILVIVFFSILLYFSIQMIFIDGSTFIETVDIPQGVFMAVFPLSSILLIVASVINIYKGLKCTL